MRKVVATDPICRAVFCLCGLLLIYCPLRAQRRDATPEEKKALLTVYHPIQDVLIKLAGDDWETDDSNFSEDFAIDPDSRFGDGYEQSFKVKQGSTRYTKLISPLEEKIKAFAESQKFDSVKALHQRLVALNKLVVSVDLNTPIMGTGTNPSANQTYVLPGVSKCFRVAQDNYAPDNAGAIVVALGNWQTAAFDKENSGFKYSFKSAPHATKVENVVIHISGASDYTLQKLKTLDWASIAKTLAP